jgi:acetylornithine deacetylase/succinyl-diaminopimelate desuccinylase
VVREAMTGNDDSTTLAAVSTEEIEELTCELIALESHDQIDQREKRVVACVAERLGREGLTVQTVPVVDGRCNVIARLEGAGGGPVLLLNGHTDTVPPGGMAEPFAPRVADDRIRGRGSADTKGTLAAMVGALAALTRSGARLTGSVVLAATIDEERNSAGARHLVDSGLRADYAIVGEPTDLGVGIAHKGVVRGTATFTGKAVHSSVPEKGINAIRKASAWIEHVEREYVPSLARKPHPLLGAPTLSLGLIRGGTQVATVPDFCEITFDRRMVPGESAAACIGELQATADAVARGDPAFRCEVRELPDSAQYPHPAFETPPESPVARELLRAHEEERGAGAHACGLSYWTDASLLARMPGCQVVVCGPGNIAQAHSVDEWVPREELYAAYRMYLRTAMRLCG